MNSSKLLRNSLQVLTAITGAIGLASIAEDWKMWPEFISNIIQQYRLIFHLPFNFIDTIIPNVWKDYLVIGLMITICEIAVFPKRLSTEDPTGAVITKVLILILGVFLWPLILPHHVIILMKYRNLKGNDTSESSMFLSPSYKIQRSIRFFHWLGFLLVIFASLIVVSLIA